MQFESVLLNTGAHSSERCACGAAVEVQQQVKAIKVQAGFRMVLRYSVGLIKPVSGLTEGSCCRIAVRSVHGFSKSCHPQFESCLR
ncbi:hypothetical protein C0046_39990, partial [Pseudomonas aeruginosa]